GGARPDDLLRRGDEPAQGEQDGDRGRGTDQRSALHHGDDEAGDDATDDEATGEDEPDNEDVGEDDPAADELAADDESDNAEAGDDEKELVPAGASSKKSTRSAKGSAVTTSGGKGRPTRKQSTAPAAPTRTGPVTFVKESAAELRKVVYPTGEQLRTFFIVVLVFVLFIIAFSSLLDLGFGWLVLRIFG
ncbi:MAG: preprotein translocase subunit SecE, partial [Propionibacteriales bacterium]|nr:preprotein translocase subunit SecE [Propionibacteriales bacterium]